MKFAKMQSILSLSALAGILLTFPLARASGGADRSPVQVTTTVTATVPDGKRMPDLGADDVTVQQGKSRLRVTDLVPAQGMHAGLELFILIDDASESRLALQYGDLKKFIDEQPASTLIGVGYMRNATVQVVQDLTPNHASAAGALRLPLGTVGAYGSPYLSVMDLMKRWPVSDNRREILMITDGIDRAGRNWHHPRLGLHTNADADSAALVAQRTGTMIHTLYTPGVHRPYRNRYVALSAQNDMTRLASKTGGEAYYLGLGSPVSFAPWLNQLQRTFNNQYLLSFSATPGRKPGLQAIRLNTELAGVQLAAPDAVWVPGLQDAGN
ncbi:MAG: hypothetical protein WBW84_17080 [Acidobacteriaceae bacterium]